jgi:hypothetical protein
MQTRKNFYVSEAATRAAVEAGVQWLQAQVAAGLTTAWLVVVTQSALDGMIGHVSAQKTPKHFLREPRFE